MASVNRLKELREAAGLSQEKLARAADISFRTVQHIEKHHGDPRLSTARRLAKALGVTVDELLPED